MQINDLFVKYGTDKQEGPHGWGYADTYQQFLTPLRGSALNVLEIGICGFRNIPNNVVGASLFAWRDFFPNAFIHGIDNDNRFVFNDQPFIKTALCNAYDLGDLAATLREWGTPTFDFICDDAVHDPMPQVFLASALFPFLKVGGVYAIEDVCPYKLPNEDMRVMLQPLIMANHMKVTEFDTGKRERLIILEKTA